MGLGVVVNSAGGAKSSLSWELMLGSGSGVRGAAWSSHREVALHVMCHDVVGGVEGGLISWVLVGWGVVGELVVSIRCPWGGEDLVVEWGKSLRRTRLKRRLRSMRSFTRG